MATPKVHNRECRSTRATLTTSPIERVIDCLYFWRIIFAAADMVDDDTKEQMRAQERNTHGEEESTIFSWKAKHWTIFKNPIWSPYNGKQNDMATRADLSYVWKIDVSKPRSRRLRVKSCTKNRSEIAHSSDELCRIARVLWWRSQHVGTSLSEISPWVIYGSAKPLESSNPPRLRPPKMIVSPKVINREYDPKSAQIYY